MKSLSILRALFALLFLTVSVNSVVAVATHSKHAVESVCSASLIGACVAPMAKQSNKSLNRKSFFKSRKTLFAAVAGGGGGAVQLIRTQSKTVGEQALMGRDPGSSGTRAGNAGTQVGNMTTPVQFVLPESTLSGKITWSLTTLLNVVATYIPYLPSKSDEALPAAVSFSGGNFVDFDDFTDFYIGQPVMLGDVLVTTTDQTNYALPIRVTKRNADGSSGTNAVTWDSISKNPSNNDQTTRIVYNSGWLIGIAQVKYELQMRQNSTLSFSAQIAQVADVRTFRPYGG